MSNLISIGLSGLNASQTALTVTSNNIINASTAGYSRQQAMTSAASLENIGVGYVGNGTTLSDVRRIYSNYLDTALQTSTSLSADSTAYATQASSTDTLLADSSTGITAVLSTFFASVQAASSDPSSVSNRQALITAGQTLSNRFNSISTQLSQQNTDINSQLTALSGQVNDLTKSIATLNQQITSMSSTGGAPNSLLDARNEAVRSLNELVGVTVQEHDGSYDITLGTGQSLVTGNTANTLSSQPSANDPTQNSLTINYKSYTSDVTSVVTGGSIGGLLRFRSDVLIPATNELGRVATVVADSVNSQLGQGLDLNGNFGSNLFASINTATAMSTRSLATSTNSAGSGNLNVSISDSSKLSTYDYNVKFSSGTAYSVMRSDGTSMGSYDLSTTPAPVIDGFTLALNGGALSAGDSFKVIPTRTGAATIAVTQTDASKLALASPLAATSGSGNSGSGSITQPVLSTKVNIYNSASQTELQSAVANSMPVKLVFSAASGGAQGYTVFDAKGNSIGTGSIVPGQSNDLSISVPMLDSTGTPLGAGKTFTFAMSIAGSPATNDSYSVGMNTNDSTDNRNASALLGLQNSSTVGVTGGTSGISLTSAYAKLVEQVGSKAAQAKTDSTATGAVLTQAKASRDSLSGVNLDEEASNLVKFQQYYTASSQIIKTAQEIFSTLINDL